MGSERRRVDAVGLRADVVRQQQRPLPAGADAEDGRAARQDRLRPLRTCRGRPFTRSARPGRRSPAIPAAPPARSRRTSAPSSRSSRRSNARPTDVLPGFIALNSAGIPASGLPPGDVRAVPGHAGRDRAADDRPSRRRHALLRPLDISCSQLDANRTSGALGKASLDMNDFYTQSKALMDAPNINAALQLHDRRAHEVRRDDVRRLADRRAQSRRRRQGHALRAGHARRMGSSQRHLRRSRGRRELALHAVRAVRSRLRVAARRSAVDARLGRRQDAARRNARRRRRASSAAPSAFSTTRPAAITTCACRPSGPAAASAAAASSARPTPPAATSRDYGWSAQPRHPPRGRHLDDLLRPRHRLHHRPPRRSAQPRLRIRPVREGRNVPADQRVVLAAAWRVGARCARSGSALVCASRVRATRANAVRLTTRAQRAANAAGQRAKRLPRYPILQIRVIRRDRRRCRSDCPSWRFFRRCR